MKNLKVRLANMVKRLRKGNFSQFIVDNPLSDAKNDKSGDFYLDKRNIKLHCPCCNNGLIPSRGIGYSHHCTRPSTEGKPHRAVVVDDQVVKWDGTLDHYSRLLEESKE